MSSPHLDRPDYELDREDLGHCRSGSAQAFDRLMRRHQQAVHALAYRFTDGDDERFDLVQEIFLKAFRELHTLRDGRRFRAWLLRIASHRAVDWLRARRRQPQGGADPSTVPQQSLVDRPASSDGLSSERSVALYQALAHLSEKARQAVIMRYFEGHSIREISLAIGMTRDSTRNLLHRALRRMRAILNSGPPEGVDHA